MNLTKNRIEERKVRFDLNQYQEKVALPNDHHLPLFFNGGYAVLEEVHP